jgi:hypothetical protein
VILETLHHSREFVGAIVHLRFTKPVLVTFPEVAPFGTTGKASEDVLARHIACRNF